MSIVSKKLVAIIGAGPSGLITAKYFKDRDWEVCIFERCSGLGGMWRYSPTPRADGSLSACYASLVSNTTKRITQFECYPMPESYPTYLHHTQVLTYLERFATYFSLHEAIRYRTHVRDILPLASGNLLWRLSYHLLNEDNLQTETFDAVAVCSGVHWSPKLPAFFSSLATLFKPETGKLAIHSSHYRESSSFHQKSILICGLGISGLEIAKDIASSAKRIYLSTSRPQIAHDLAATLSQQARVTAELYVLPEVQGIDEVARLFLFGDNCSPLSLDHLEIVICCTGFEISIPFLDLHALDILHVTPTSHLRLYRRFLSIQYPQLAFIGHATTFGSLHTISEVQARMFVNFLSDTAPLSSDFDRKTEVARWFQTQAASENVNAGWYRFLNLDYWPYITEMKLHLDASWNHQPPIRPRWDPLLKRSIKQEQQGDSVVFAAVQAPSGLGTVLENRARFLRLVRQAVETYSAKFVVLPEAAITGYLSPDLKQSWHLPLRPLGKSQTTQQSFLTEGFGTLEEAAEYVPGDSTRLFGQLARELGVYITIPLIEKRRRASVFHSEIPSFLPRTNELHDFYNTCVVVGPSGEILAHYRKNHLWGIVDYGWASAGTKTAVFQTEYGSCGVAICFDVHKMFARYAREHPDLWVLLYPIAWVDNDAASWFAIDLPIIVNGFYVVGANWSVFSEEQARLWKGHGHSSIYAPDGSILSSTDQHVGESFVVAAISPRVSSAQPSLPENIPVSSSSDLLHPHLDPAWTQRSNLSSSSTSMTIDICGKHVSVDRIQADPDRIGCAVWDAALVAAKYFERLSVEGVVSLHGQKVLELGSGTGILGLSLMALGADVWLTDKLTDNADLRDLLQRNAELNEKDLAMGSANIEHFDWFSPDLPHRLIESASAHPFKWIVASDVVYDETIVDAFVHTLIRCCTQLMVTDFKIIIAIEQHHWASLVRFYKTISRYFEIFHVPIAELHPVYTCPGISIKQLFLRHSTRKQTPAENETSLTLAAPDPSRLNPWMSSHSSTMTVRDAVAPILEPWLQVRPTVSSLVEKGILSPR